MKIEFTVCADISLRLDQYLADALQISRQQLKASIKDGLVELNMKIVTKPSSQVNFKDHVSVKLKEVGVKRQLFNVQYDSNLLIKTDQYDIPIIYEDDQLLIINKPYGLVVHPAPTIQEITLTEILQAAEIPLAISNHRPGIVHRLDQFTEGLMIIAKTNHAFLTLQEQFRSRSIRKNYYAVLVGKLAANEGTIDKPIGRDSSVRARQSCNHYVKGTEKDAITHFTVLNKTTTVLFADIDLVTGRTHQIRVHFSAMNCPVLGDSLYSQQKQRKEGYYLQCHTLEFSHPETLKTLLFSIPVSKRLEQYAKNK